MTPQLISEKDAARYLGMSRIWLAKSRMDGNRTGHSATPPYVKCGGRAIRYALADLDSWIEQHRVAPKGC